MGPITLKIRLSTLGVIMASCFFFSCSSGKSTEDIPSVPSVDLTRYMGVWYEIARLDHSFERGLTHTTATYTLNDNGTVAVLNQGKKEGKPSKANGKARLVDKAHPGVFNVRFFGPFGGLYKIIALDSTGYQYSMITSGTRNYFWILSRTPKMDETLYQSLIERARAWDFDVASLIRVPQD